MPQPPAPIKPLPPSSAITGQPGALPERAFASRTLPGPVGAGVRVGTNPAVLGVGEGKTETAAIEVGVSGIASGEWMCAVGDGVVVGAVCASWGVWVSRGVVVGIGLVRVGRGVGVRVGRGVRVGVAVLPGGTGVQAPLMFSVMVLSSTLPSCPTTRSV